ncbi:MAG TPA: T9SS type A sorting domain-containing protein, partial [Rubricoccaceae bacterium]
ERSASGTVSQRYPCRLDLNLTGSDFRSCSIGITYSKRPDTVLGVPTTRLSFGYDFGTTQVAAGLGLVLTVDEGTWTDLVYARTAAQTVGAPVDALPFAPDPTPAADYYPLDVGNEWMYRYSEQSVYGIFDRLERRRVLREETVGGQTYAVDQTCTYNLRDAAPGWACGTERRLRFDPATTNVVQRIGDAERVEICRLGADFGAPADCDGSAYVGYVDAGTEVVIGGTPYTVARVKGRTSLANVPPPAYIAGIGEAERPVGAFQTSRFEFARVRGVEYGARPVSGESGAPAAAAFALAATPNPTAGALRLALTLPEAQTVTAEAFDALGRRVWQQTAALAAGSQTLTVDASAWAPGVYVLRATAGRASATARIVRR